jgi:cell division protein FtsB
MQRPDPLFKLRMPRELRALLETAAMARGRSITAEILDRLIASFPTAREQIAALAAQVAQLSERVEQLEKQVARIAEERREE